MIQTPLSKEEFATALKHGRGRVFRHAQLFGLSDVVDIVLDACLTNPVYDRQCESRRAPWLFSLIHGAPEYEWLSSRIIAALDDASENHDFEHVCDLAGLIGRAGNVLAADALRKRVLGQSFAPGEDEYGCHALVVVDGIDAVVELARRYGALLIDSPDTWQPSLTYFTDGLDILPEAEIRLQQLAEEDPAIQAFWEREKSSLYRRTIADGPSKDVRQQEVRNRFRSENSMESILADASSGVGEIPSRYMLFGRYATDPELANVMRHLAAETNEETCLRLLWVFRKTPLPELHSRVFELAESKNDKLRRAAIVALAHTRDSRVGDLGRARLLSPEFSGNESALLDIFIKNYQSGDEQLIMSALSRISPDEERAHDFGFSILDICEENGSTGFRELLNWNYNANPCTICRYKVLGLLIDAGDASSEIIAECLHDADEDTRERSKEYLAKYSSVESG